MESLSELDMWAALVGFLMPLLIAVINSSHWGSAVRACVAAAACVAAGFGTAAVGGQLAGLGTARAVLVVLFTALGTYRAFWHPSGIAPALEEATTPYQPRYRRSDDL